MGRRTRGSVMWGCALAAVVATSAVMPVASAQTTYGYDMDETSGTTLTGSGGIPNGTISGDVQLGVAGVTGTGYAFNERVGSCDSSWNVTGTGSVAIASSSVWNVGSQPFRFTVWLKTTTVPGADSGASADCDFDIWRRSSKWRMELIPRGTSPNVYGVPHCSWKGSLNGTVTHVALSGKSSVTDGSWHQVTCARTSTGEQLLVDHQVVASSSRDLGSIDTTGKVFVGAQRRGADYYEGELDDLSFVVG